MANADTLKAGNKKEKAKGKSFKTKASAEKEIASSDVPLEKVWDPTTKSWYLRQKYDDDQLKIMRGGRYPRA